MAGQNLAALAGCTSPYVFDEGLLDVQGNAIAPLRPKTWHVVVVDFGVKRMMLRMLVHFGCAVTVVPGDCDAPTIRSMNPDGVLLSNGPGDPAAATSAVRWRPW